MLLYVLQQVLIQITDLTSVELILIINNCPDVLGTYKSTHFTGSRLIQYLVAHTLKNLNFPPSGMAGEFYDPSWL